MSSTDQITAKLSAVLTEIVDRGVPGLSAAIASSKGVLWSSTAGLSDISNDISVSDDSVFGVGSITKVFMSVVILQLIDEGRLKLSDRVSYHLHENVWHGIPHAKDATISSLLRHTSGIPSWEDDTRWIRCARGKYLDLCKMWTSSEPLEFIRYDDNPLVVPPSPSPEAGHFSYSNTNFTLLGLIAEAITSDSAASLIRTRIHEPLSLRHTHIEGHESPQEGLPTNRYHWLNSEFLRVAGQPPGVDICETLPDLLDVTSTNLSTEWVAGGNLSHPVDLCTFALAVRNGHILSPSSLEIMYELVPMSEKTPNALVGHGIFRVDRGEGGMWYGHNGSALGFAGSMFWNADTDVAIAVLGNVGTMHAGGGSAPSAALACADTSFLQLAMQLAAHD